MTSNTARAASLVVLALTLVQGTARAAEPEALVRPQLGPASAPATPVSLGNPALAAMAGTWLGGGTIDLTGEIHERLRCRATYNYGQSSNLALAIRCASDNYKFELTSNVVERHGQLSGRWSEATYNVTGSINGHIVGNKVSAVAQSDGLNADISVVTNGNRQSVTITPKATYVINVQIALNRH
jgi:hypothetical protein